MNRLSIITVTYNAEKSLAKTIRSVLAQEYRSYEYIIVDGNSTDETLNIIKKYERYFDKKGISFRYVSEKDNGIYDAMNKGIRMASKSSEWITFLNADDYYCDRQVLRDIFEKNDLSIIDCIYGDTIIKRENGQKYRKKASSIETIDYKVPFVHQALFARKKWIEKYLFSDRWKLAADYEQWIRIYLAGAKYKQIARDIVVYDASGTSGKRYKEYVNEMLNIQKTYDLTKKHKIQRYIRGRLIPSIKENRVIFYLYAKINAR